MLFGHFFFSRPSFFNSHSSFIVFVVLTLCLLGSSGAHFFIDFYKTSTKNNPITLSFAAVLQYFFAFLRQLLLDSKCFFASFSNSLHLTAVLQYYWLFSWAFSASHSSFIVCLCSPGLSLALLGLIFLSIFIRLPQKTTLLL